MRRRLAVLYARSRSVPIALTVVIAAAVVGGVLAAYLASRPSGGVDPRRPVAVGFAMLAAFAFGSTLSSPMQPLEASTPRPWIRWRTIQALTGVVVVAAILFPSLPWTHDGMGTLVRNAIGLSGLALVAAAILGGQLAWTLPLVYGMVVYVVGGGTGGGRQFWAFVMAPASAVTPAMTALVIFAIGLVAWSLHPET